ncbi:MAG: hypothetical protein GTO63_10465 [Anaerolineae bacterium]|nr:hypothetical protein [Anaerolineae bacterium]NIN95326.1 hypothetical protein [Anaerolineae bacterium]NIQ78290.1 hypothetical protein [Anaerolineae bacterium]
MTGCAPDASNHRDYHDHRVRDLLAVFLLGLAMRTLVALPQQQPHYFDAYYYYNVAENLSLGRGFVVDFIWNYLQSPDTVTHASNLYWMPLTSIIAWPFLAILGASYRAAQIPFVLLSALLPVIAYYLSYRIYGRRDYALLSATLTAFAPFYLRYWASPDNFTPFAVAAGLSLITIYLGWSKRAARYFLFTGLLFGLSHLARADGILLWAALLATLVIIWLRTRTTSNAHTHQEIPFRTCLFWLLLAVVGYLAIMGPWFYRNWQLIGAPLSGAGTKTIFLRDYADIFSYSKELSLQNYLAWGWGAILRSKFSAAVHNLAVILGALQFHLAPVAFVGLWQLRRRKEHVPFYVYAATLYLAMTLVFTFPSTHASMLHSTGALLPFLFVAAVPGIDAVVGWIAARRRTWHPRTAKRFFRVGLTVVLVTISLFEYSRAVFLSLNPVAIEPLWNRANTSYLTVQAWLDGNSAGDAPVMVVDPPAYYYFTHRPAIVIPNDDIEGIIEVADRYGADYLILEYDHVAFLDPLYHGDATHHLLDLQHAFEAYGGSAIQIYRIRR